MTDYDRSLDTPGVLPGVTTEAVTDADGRFRLEGLGRERLARLNIRGPGVAETSIVVMTREAADVHVAALGASEDLVTYGASFTLALERGRTVTGVVRDKASGAPLADVWVGPGMEAIAALETGRYPDATDAQGRFATRGHLGRSHGAPLRGDDGGGPVAFGASRPGRAEAGPALFPGQGPRERRGRGRRGLPAGHPVPPDAPGRGGPPGRGRGHLFGDRAESSSSVK